MDTETSANTEVIHRCLRPGCGRKLTNAVSIALGYGPKCAAKIRMAETAADLTAWTESQVEEARQAMEDGAVVPSNRAGVFHVVSSDGTEVHLTHRNGCNCTNGLRTLPPRPCWHRCAVAIVLAASAPAAPAALAPAPVRPDFEAELERLNEAFMSVA